LQPEFGDVTEPVDHPRSVPPAKCSSFFGGQPAVLHTAEAMIDEDMVDHRLHTRHSGMVQLVHMVAVQGLLPDGAVQVLFGAPYRTGRLEATRQPSMQYWTSVPAGCPGSSPSHSRT
jgi:hypothetical protein